MRHLCRLPFRKLIYGNLSDAWAKKKTRKKTLYLYFIHLVKLQEEHFLSSITILWPHNFFYLRFDSQTVGGGEYPHFYLHDTTFTETYSAITDVASTWPADMSAIDFFALGRHFWRLTSTAATNMIYFFFPPFIYWGTSSAARYRSHQVTLNLPQGGK